MGWPVKRWESKTNIYLRCRVPTAMRQGSKVKALVEAGVGHTTGHGAAWDQPEVKCRKILVTEVVIIVITASVPR